jgi:hypothetical protein
MRTLRTVELYDSGHEQLHTMPAGWVLQGRWSLKTAMCLLLQVAAQSAAAAPQAT